MNLLVSVLKIVQSPCEIGRATWLAGLTLSVMNLIVGLMLRALKKWCDSAPKKAPPSLRLSRGLTRLVQRCPTVVYSVPLVVWGLSSVVTVLEALVM